MSENIVYSDQCNMLDYISKHDNYKNAFKNKKVIVCTHQTKETYQFLMSVIELGGIVFYIPVNFSQSYDFAPRKNLKIVSFENLKDFIHSIDIIFEDGARITKQILSQSIRSLLKPDIFSVEQTTNGIKFLDSNNAVKSLYPILDVAHSEIKKNIENLIAVPETILNAYLSVSHKHLCGRKILIIGFGSIGSGLANLCRSFGAQIYIYDIDPVKRMIAQKNGYISLTDTTFFTNIPFIDLFISSTDNADGSLLNDEIFLRMKNGSEVINTGSYTGEISQKILSNKHYIVNHALINILAKQDHLIYSMEKRGEKKQVIIYNQGYPINLRQKKGVHDDIMQFTFGLMILVSVNKMLSSKSYENGVNAIPYFIEQKFATMYEAMQSVSTNDTPYLKVYNNTRLVNRDFGGVIALGEGEAGPTNFSVAKVFFKQHSTTAGHYHHSSQESYYVQEGKAKITIWHFKDSSKKYIFNVSKGNYLYIPPLYIHTVETKDQELHCLVIAGPKFSFWDQFFNNG